MPALNNIIKLSNKELKLKESAKKNIEPKVW
jgi:hypothetical protein